MNQQFQRLFDQYKTLFIKSKRCVNLSYSSLSRPRDSYLQSSHHGKSRQSRRLARLHDRDQPRNIPTFTFFFTYLYFLRSLAITYISIHIHIHRLNFVIVIINHHNII